MSNLVSTRIVNKNGVATTVYKRQGSVAEETSAIPAPNALQTVTPHLSHNELVEEVASGVYDMNRDEDGDDAHIYWDSKRGCYQVDTIENVLNQHDDETLLRLRAVFSGKTLDDLSDHEIPLMNAVFEGRGTSYINALETIAPLIHTGKGNSGIETLLDSLEFYHMPELSLDNFSESTAPQIAAILNTVCIFERHKQPAWEEDQFLYQPGREWAGAANPSLISSSILIDLLIKRPRQADSIAQIVLQRGNPKEEDVAFIEELLDSETPSIAEGAL